MLETERKIERKKTEEVKKNITNRMRKEKGLAPINDLKDISNVSNNEAEESIDV